MAAWEFDKPVSVTKKKRLDWTREELILALDLYFKDPTTHGNDKHPAVIELSELLLDLPIHAVAMRLPNFRNANGVGLKLVNFRALDPRFQGVGMSQGAAKDREVWNQYAHELVALKAEALSIRELYKTLDPAELVPTGDDEGVYEGGIRAAIHKRYERDSAIVRKKKKDAFALHMALRCEVCDFDFARIYGELGNQFAECHHTKPVSKMTHGDKTRLEDLSIVCSNCHRMLHRSHSLLSIAALRKILDSEKTHQSIKSTFGKPNN
jgi:5-methylcytosine-specific restriction enzyme A